MTSSDNIEDLLGDQKHIMLFNAIKNKLFSDCPEE